MHEVMMPYVTDPVSADTLCAQRKCCEANRTWERARHTDIACDLRLDSMRSICTG